MTSANYRPAHGADSAEAWQPKPWKAVIEDRWGTYGGERRTVRIPAAIGRHDAKSQAEDLYPEYVVLTVEEAA